MVLGLKNDDEEPMNGEYCVHAGPKWQACAA